MGALIGALMAFKPLCQWSKSSANNTGTTVTFPVSFNSTFINITMGSEVLDVTSLPWKNLGGECFGVVNNKNFKIYFGHRNSQTIYYHAIGY